MPPTKVALVRAHVAGHCEARLPGLECGEGSILRWAQSGLQRATWSDSGPSKLQAACGVLSCNVRPIERPLYWHPSQRSSVSSRPLRVPAEPQSAFSSGWGWGPEAEGRGAAQRPGYTGTLHEFTPWRCTPRFQQAPPASLASGSQELAWEGTVPKGRPPHLFSAQERTAAIVTDSPAQ